MKKYWVRGFKNLVILELKLFMRTPPAFFFTIVFPIILLLLFGVFPIGNIKIFGPGQEGIPGVNIDELPNYRVVDFLVPGLIAMIIAQSSLIGLPISLAELRESGAIKRYQVSPIPLWLVVIAHISAVAVIILISCILTIIIAELVFDIIFGGSVLFVLAATLLSTTMFFSIGFLIASQVHNARTAQAVGSILFFPMFFLSGMVGPRRELPTFIAWISEILPLTWSVEALASGAWLNIAPPMAQFYYMALMAVTSCIVFVIAKRRFKWEG